MLPFAPLHGRIGQPLLLELHTYELCVIINEAISEEWHANMYQVWFVQDNATLAFHF